MKNVKRIFEYTPMLLPFIKNVEEFNKKHKATFNGLYVTFNCEDYVLTRLKEEEYKSDYKKIRTEFKLLRDRFSVKEEEKFMKFIYRTKDNI